MQHALHAAQVTRLVNCMQDPSSIPISGSHNVSGIDDGLGRIGIRISICSLMGDSFSVTIGLPWLQCHAGGPAGLLLQGAAKS